MSNITKVVLAGFVLFSLLCCAIVGGSYVSAHNYGNSAEAGLNAQIDDSKNIRATYTTKMAEMAQVPAMYKKDLADIIDKTFAGRYGDGGSKAMVQFIKESNLSLDSSMYKRLMDVMESGRNDFQNSQTKLIDMKRSYVTALGSFWQGWWLKIAGYPRINLDAIQPVINQSTDDAFRTHRDEGVKLQ